MNEKLQIHCYYWPLSCVENCKARSRRLYVEYPMINGLVGCRGGGGGSVSTLKQGLNVVTVFSTRKNKYKKKYYSATTRTGPVGVKLTNQRFT